MGQLDFGLTAPAKQAFAIVPHDTNELPEITRGLYIGGAGNVRVEMKNGAVVTFTALSVGVIHSLQVVRVHATLTTATNIVGVF